MRTWKPSRLFTLGVAAILLGGTAHAQQTVYKWVDANGVVHFSDEPPAGSEAANVEIITTDRGPTYVPPRQPASAAPAAPAATSGVPSPAPQAAVPALIEAADIASMSLPELDRRCDDARERRIAPLREAEIAKCKEDGRNDPGWCERFNADFGEGGRTVQGTVRPRMFDDLPECVEALQERNRRGR